jgi:hypothetical protein
MPIATVQTHARPTTVSVEPAAVNPMRSCGKRRWIWLVLLTGFFDLRAASAEVWRYCLASSHAQRTVHFSQIFPSDLDINRLQREFGRELDRVRIQHDSVQCPQGDQQSIAIMRQHAIRFNRELGNSIVELDWGSTASGGNDDVARYLHERH